MRIQAPGKVRRFIAAIGLAGAMAVPISVLGTSPAMAYGACPGTSSTTSSSSTVVNGGSQFSMTTAVTDCNGGGVGGVTVTFGTQAGPCPATFSQTQTTTDANGVATTIVTLPPNCPCQYVLKALAAGVSSTTTVRENGCLPFTSAGTLAPVTTGSTPWRDYLLVMAAVALLGAGAGLALRRRSR